MLGRTHSCDNTDSANKPHTVHTPARGRYFKRTASTLAALLGFALVIPTAAPIAYGANENTPDSASSSVLADAGTSSTEETSARQADGASAAPSLVEEEAAVSGSGDPSSEEAAPATSGADAVNGADRAATPPHYLIMEIVPLRRPR